MPEFLKPLILANFDAALFSRGLVRDEDSDLHAVIRYRQLDLSEGSPSGASRKEQVSPGGNVRFIARVEVDIFDSVTREPVFRGSIQRIHDVDPGEYMHTGQASGAIYEAFSQLLADFRVAEDAWQDSPSLLGL